MKSSLKHTLAQLRYGLVWRKPRAMARMAGFMVKSLVVKPKVPPLRYVDLALDYGCNLRCEHCFAEALKATDRKRMTPAQYGSIARQAKALGAVHLSFQGGEPTLCRDLPEILAAIQPHDVLVSLTTNGTQLTHEYCCELRSLGVDQLNVSLDSDSMTEHDAFRGKPGSWIATMDGIACALDAGLNVQINTTVSHQNLHTPGFRNLLAYWTARRTIVNLVLAAPAGEWAGADSVLLTSEDSAEVRQLIEGNPYLRHDMDAVRLGFGCPAAKEAIYVTAYGDAMPCPFIHVGFGDLTKTPLAGVMQRMRQVPELGGRANHCLAAEDADWIDAMGVALSGKQIPAPHQDVFGEHL